LLVDQYDDGSFGSSTDFAIVLQNVTSLSAADINGPIIGILNPIF